jgi:hypothetical protein
MTRRLWRRFCDTTAPWHEPPAWRSLGAGRPANMSPPGVPRPNTYEPWDDVDPMPDYENVLTD